MDCCTEIGSSSLMAEVNFLGAHTARERERCWDNMHTPEDRERERRVSSQKKCDARQEMTSDAWTLNDGEETTSAQNTNESRKKRRSTSVDVWFSFQQDRPERESAWRRFARRNLVIRHLRANSPVIQSMLHLFASLLFNTREEERGEKRGERQTSSPRVRLSNCDWPKISIGRVQALINRPTRMKGVFSLSLSLSRRKRETEKPQFLLPSASHSSLLLERCRQPTRRKLTASATEIQSLLIVHCISVQVLSLSPPRCLSVGRRHDFKEVRDLKASSLLVRPTTTYIHTDT